VTYASAMILYLSGSIYCLYTIFSKEIAIDDISIIVKVEYPTDLENNPLRTIKRKPAPVLFL